MRLFKLPDRRRDVAARANAARAPSRQIASRLWRVISVSLHRPSRRTVTTAVGTVLGVAFLVGGLAQVRLETTVGSFLPRDDPAVAQVDELARSFGGDPVVVLLESSKPDELLDQQHIAPLLQLEGKLAALPGSAAVYGPATMLNQIAGQARNLLTELAGQRDAAREQAIAQAKAHGAPGSAAESAGDQAVHDFDTRYGPLVVQAMPAGLPTLRNPSFVNTVVYAPGGRPRPQWKFVAPSDHAVAILLRPAQGLDEAATDRLVTGVRDTVTAAHLADAKVTVSGVPVLAAAVGTEVRHEVPLLGGLAIIAVSGCFLLVPWTRWRRRLLPVATTLVSIAVTLAVFGWLRHPLSLGVVAFLSVLLGVGSYYPTYFAQRAGRRVVLVVAAGTSASFTALLLSPLPFVRDLGMTLSLGVLVAALLGLLLVARFDARFDARPADPPRRPAPSRSRSTGVSRGRRVIAATVLVALAAAGWAGLPRLPLDSDFGSLAGGLPALAEAQHVESVIGSSGEMDVVLTGPNTVSAEALGWMRQAQERIITAYGDRMRPIISPTSLLGFLGDRPTSEQVAAGVRILPAYLTGSVLRDDMRVALLGFGVRMEDLGALRQLRDGVLGQLPPPPPGFQVRLTGLPIAAVRGDELVSAQRVISNLGGVLAAGLVLLVGLRRRGDAVRAALAAATATGLGLLALRIIGMPLSPATAALGSLTAAVGCEFTVLLAASVRSGNPALRRSVVLATVSSALGYAVLAASGLAVVRDFGIVLACSVVLAFGAAACVVWATTGRDLAGPPTADTAVDLDRPTHLVGVKP